MHTEAKAGRWTCVLSLPVQNRLCLFSFWSSKANIRNDPVRVNVPHIITTCPSISMMTGTTPFSLVKPWYDMFLAALLVQMKMSPLAVSKPIYFMSGLTQQLVWPNMVSGLRVAATRKMFLPFTPLQNRKRDYHL